MLSYTMLPTFFMISGMLFYSRKQRYADRVATFWKKFDRLMIPYALVFMISLSLGLSKIGIASCWGHLWFVKDLFIFFCIALLAYNIKERWLVSTAAICFLLWCMQAHLGITLGDELGKLMQYGIFFFGGHYVAIYFEWMRKNRFFKWGTLTVWIIALVLHKQTASMVLFNVVAMGFVSVRPVESKMIKYFDQQSYRVYLIHHLVLFGLFPLPCFHVYAHTAVGAAAIMYIAVIAVTLAVCYVMTKIKFKYF